MTFYLGIQAEVCRLSWTTRDCLHARVYQGLPQPVIPVIQDKLVNSPQNPLQHRVKQTRINLF